jgi:short-subunit dehydrogenase
MKAAPVRTKTVMVTGCSSGIGAATAAMLRDRGWRVFPTARKDEDLRRLREQKLEAIPLDMADSASVGAAADQVFSLLDGQALGALVNNAGFGQGGALEDVSREALRYQFEVNLFGLQELTNRFLPGFRARGYGRVVNISSVVGRVSLPFYGSYSATKFALEAVSDALRVELAGTGIAVSLVEPGPITTRFGENARKAIKERVDVEASRYASVYRAALQEVRADKKYPFEKPPEAVAKKIVHALESSRPRRRYCVTVPAYLGAVLRRVAPDGLLDRVMASRLTKRLDQGEG